MEGVQPRRVGYIDLAGEGTLEVVGQSGVGGVYFRRRRAARERVSSTL